VEKRAQGSNGTFEPEHLSINGVRFPEEDGPNFKCTNMQRNTSERLMIIKLRAIIHLCICKTIKNSFAPSTTSFRGVEGKCGH